MNNSEYPGRETDGKYCAGCHYPIDENGDCHCGWNHTSRKRRDNDRTLIILPPELENSNPEKK